MRILIAVDHSTESHDAVENAYAMFGDDADYTICSISQRPAVYLAGVPGGGIGSAPEIAAQLDAARAQAEAAVIEAKAHLPTDAELEIDTGHVGEAICRVAVEHDVELLVIGSHDRSIWDRLFDPSVGRYLIEHAPCPVLVVR